MTKAHAVVEFPTPADRPSAKGAEILKFDGVSFAYDDRAILDHVSFSIRRGEIVSLLGPSGCGKTTILNIIAGFLAPTSGYAFIEEKEITGPGPDRGVVFQSYALFDWMTVEDNIAFSLTCARRPVAERREVARRMAALVGLGGSERAYPYQLSGGMRQRCGLARVLAANPTLMLMDEPFAAVDVQTRETLQEEILRIQHETGCTIVFVTHSIEEAVFLSDRILLLTDLASGAFVEFAVDLPQPRWSPENRLHERFVALRERIYRSMRSAAKPPAGKPARQSGDAS
jgi:ABC-type nitrate/sulfonate/bicarbonate transport system ATPase subunit